MISRRSQLSIIVILSIFLLVTSLSRESVTTTSYNDSSSDSNNVLHIQDGDFEVAGTQDEASWWNSTFIYRRFYNISEPGVSDRILTPIHLFLTFEDGHCYKNSLRVLYYDNPGWTELPFQNWNTTYFDGNEFIKSTRISFMVNVTEGDTERSYYIYYAKEDVGSVFYSDFYPFIYKSYTMSLIHLASYYDDNNYTITKWHSATSSWVDPRTIDGRWSGSSGSVYPSNIPYGTIDKYEAARYEPSTYSTTLFNGYYRIHSFYPLTVHMGQGDEGQNSIINDWFPGVGPLGSGTATQFVIGGVEGASGGVEGKYWIQAQEDDTNVYVWTSSLAEDNPSLWKFYNNSALTSWPAVLDAGEYISKINVNWQTIMMVNSTKPVSYRAGDEDSSYARDIQGFYPDITGALAGEEFYTIDMGHSNDYTRVTNLGDTQVTVEWWRNSDGAGWVKGTDLVISVNSSQNIARGDASSSNQEDIIHIKGSVGSMLKVEGIYNPPNSMDAGDWEPSVTGSRFGSKYKIWTNRDYRVMFVALENAKIRCRGYGQDVIVEIPAGGMGMFHPTKSSPHGLYHFDSNVSIGVLNVARFSTSAPYNPTGDTGYGWIVPCYTPEQDSAGFSIELGEERHLFEFDITVVDLDGTPVEGATVTLYNTTDDTLWLDDNNKDRTGTTDSNGMIIFEGLNNGTYNVSIKIDAKSWLITNHANVWVVNQSDHDITGSVTPIEVVLPMGSFYIHYEDLMGNSMDQTADETTTVRATDIMDQTADGSDYIEQVSTNGTGWAEFHRLPKNDYRFFVDYSGNVSDYDYDEILEFANWSISEDEFGPQPFIHNDWILPLITLEIHVRSWDNLPVSGANIKINNSMSEFVYSITEVSDTNGNFTFYRVVNGTWNIDVWKEDDYPVTDTVRNNTVSVLTQDFSDKIIYLPLTRLNIWVQTDPYTFVSGAQVNVTLIGEDLVAQGTTNGTGQITFTNIHGNMSSPSLVSYNITVIAGDNPPVTAGFSTEILAKCDWEWWWSNNITISTPQYLDAYTELNSTYYILNKRWGENATFIVGYYDRDDSGTSIVSLDETSWVNFTIYLGQTEIGKGTWNSSKYDWVKNATTNNLNFTVTIDTDHWLMNVSETAYTIKVNAHTDGYLDPAALTVYLTIQAAETEVGYDQASINEYYKTHFDHVYYLNDTTNKENVTFLDTYEYLVKFGAVPIRQGTLQESGEEYILPKSVLRGLDTGTYTLIITLEKRNYINQTMIFDVSINDIPMNVENIVGVGYDWSLQSHSITFQYNFDGATYVNGSIPNNLAGLSDVTVDIEWLTNGDVSYLNVSKTLSASAGTFTYTFDRNLLPVGLWKFIITCSKPNYVSATSSPTLIDVNPADTELEAIGPDTLTVNWLETAEFFANFTRIDDGEGLEGASLTHNLTSSAILDHQGGGIYSISVSTDLDASTYGVQITLSISNHEDARLDLSITIKIPLFIKADYDSAENPLNVYWTHSFDIGITLQDLSRDGESVEGATVTYYWFQEAVIDQSGDLDDFTGGIYNITLNASNALPMDDLYRIQITAEKAGATTVTANIFIRIRSVPNKIELPTQYYEQFYADVFDVTFYWNNTLDNIPISEYTSATYSIFEITDNVTTGSTTGDGWFTFSIDTKSLDMDANAQGSVYVIQITMTGIGYDSHELTTVIILVKETDASLIIDPIDTVNWTDDVTITASLYDALHGGLIWEDAEIMAAYGPYSKAMTNNLDGTFTVTFTSSDWFAASSSAYDVVLTYTLPNYVDSTNSSSILINPISGSIIRQTPTGASLAYTWSEIFTLSVRVQRTYGAIEALLGADVFYLWSGYETERDLTYQSSTFDYNTTVDASEVPAGEYTLIVRVDNENYTIPDLTVPVTVNTVDTSLTTDEDLYEVFYTDTGLDLLIEFAIDDDSVALSVVLENALITMNYAGNRVDATYQPDTGLYILRFNPSEIDVNGVPGVYTLNITASLTNFTSQEVHPTLNIYALTSLAGKGETVQETQTFTIAFQYLDTANNIPIGPDIATSVTLVTPLVSISKDDFTYNDTHYLIQLTTTQIGGVRAEAYNLLISASAPMYENQTDEVIQVIIIEIQVDILGLGILHLPKSLYETIIYMTGLFVVLAGIIVGIRRWKIPFQIKQINKAIKSMEKGKSASVDGIKSMGSVISELLAPGLADLAIKAPHIDVVYEAEIGIELGEETEELLDELEALDEIGVEEPEAIEEAEDFEAELAAELEEIVEEEEEPEVEPEVEAEEPEVVEEELEEVAEEPEEEPEAEPEALEEADEPELEEVSEELEEELEGEDEIEAEEPEESLEEEKKPEDERLEEELDTEIEKPEEESEVLEEEPEIELDVPTREDLISELPEYIIDSFTKKDLEHLTDEELKVLSKLSKEEFEAFKAAHSSDSEE